MIESLTLVTISQWKVSFGGSETISSLYLSRVAWDNMGQPETIEVEVTAMKGAGRGD